MIKLVTTLIASNPTEKRVAANDGSKVLYVAENFCDTVQGENFSGVPSVFLRMQGCTLSCVWCDTLEVWRFGNPYSVIELFRLWEDKGVIERLKNDHHLILTGGSPVKQQDGLVDLIDMIVNVYGFDPFVEIENECTLMPSDKLFNRVKLWNNSPKLANSKMGLKFRYKPEILKKLNNPNVNGYFKFVISSESDWDEIKKDFLDSGLIDKSKIVIMPEGVTRDELHEKYEWLVDLACRENVRMCDRLHVTIWNKKTGV